MATLVAANLDPGSNQAWERLFIAFALSLFLHLALLLGVPVNPTSGVPFVTSMISARLEPEASETPVETTVEPLLPEVANPALDKSAVTDPLADPATKAESKPEPRPAATPPPSTPSPGIDMPLIRDPTYYPSTQVDVWPRLVADMEQPPCPAAALADRINGTAQILLLINEFGIIDDIGIVEAKPESYFEDSALALFRGKRFYPAERQGRSVKSRALIRITFTCGDNKSATR